MPNLRQEKVSSAIRKTAGEFINSTSGIESMITAIRADVSKDLKNATVFVTVFPESEEKKALEFLKRRRSDFREFFKNRVKIKTLPMFDFKIDIGEKHRQRIDELSKS
jgi:ribosome-binding factor A